MYSHDLFHQWNMWGYCPLIWFQSAWEATLLSQSPTLRQVEAIAHDPLCMALRIQYSWMGATIAFHVQQWNKEFELAQAQRIHKRKAGFRMKHDRVVMVIRQRLL